MARWKKEKQNIYMIFDDINQAVITNFLFHFFFFKQMKIFSLPAM